MALAARSPGDPSAGTVSGNVSFLAQDGQTSPVFGFTGSEQSGVATVQRDNGGGPISFTAGAQDFQLGGCDQYLQWVESLNESTFRYAPEGLAG
jgi:hypothetical protein